MGGPKVLGVPEMFSNGIIAMPISPCRRSRQDISLVGEPMNASGATGNTVFLINSHGPILQSGLEQRLYI
jgi:hypothetical protein